MLVPLSPFFLTTRLGVPENDISFWSTVLLAAYAGVLLLVAPLSGILSDRFRTRLGPLRLAMLVLAAAIVMIATAKSLAVLVVGRLAQGFAASIIWVVGPALLVEGSSGHEAGRDMGYVSLACGAGLLSPLFSGPLYHRAGYLSVFAVAFALIGCGLIVCLSLIDRGAPSHSDLASSAGGSSDPDVERTAATPTDEHEPLRWRSLSVCTVLYAVVMGNAVSFVCDIIVPVYTVRLFGWNSLGTGLVMIALRGPTILLGPGVGKFCDRYGARWPTSIGLGCCCVGLISCRLVQRGQMGDKVGLVALLALIGCGFCIADTAVMAFFANKRASALDFAIYNIFVMVPGVVGPFALGDYKNRGGWSQVTTLLGVGCGIGLILCGFCGDSAPAKPAPDPVDPPAPVRVPGQGIEDQGRNSV
ncbi:uncharacterized protein A1O9_13091 [Exophiala aquamarina CBS 119918]|uniref:Major facilitator superfamily (MFS) profile domain-containing protein n=1 Tax=Exophiala aquamarina CBS 119918 TaxID=1182545 RepID=A0A072NSM8_9EURO|nr:uncharacterized protein A1O9_13091 [Exophiala aquamarina CBS 119918]KEF50854.1 hypothetical protein A1O9_13091 [Exophiala aquamarina CBS 119918]